MSRPLFKTELKASVKLLILFMCIVTMYGSIITAMYDPETGAGMNAMAESMPELFAAFGMADPGFTLLDFLINYLYGFILLVFPFIFSILMCYRLMAKYIDRGSMAYLLNSHYSRKQIIFTQIGVLLLDLILLTAYTVVMLLLCSHFMFEGELEISKFLVVNAGLLVLHVFLAAMCFLFASLFNEIRYSVGIGAGLGILFFLIQMLSQVSEDIDFLKYATPLTLFNPEMLAENDSAALAQIANLGVQAVIFFTIAVTGFRKRDLPL